MWHSRVKLKMIWVQDDRDLQKQAGQTFNSSGHAEPIIGSMYTVGPGEREWYFPSVLLHHISGARSFKDMETVNSTVHTTYWETCARLELPSDGTTWKSGIRDTPSSSFVPVIYVYATTLAHFYPINPLKIFLTCQGMFVEDIRSLYRNQIVLNDEHSALSYVVFEI